MRIAGHAPDARDQEVLAQVATIHQYLIELRNEVTTGTNRSTSFAALARSRPVRNAPRRAASLADDTSSHSPPSRTGLLPYP